jgi:hypothetical protein
VRVDADDAVHLEATDPKPVVGHGRRVLRFAPARNHDTIGPERLRARPSFATVPAGGVLR